MMDEQTKSDAEHYIRISQNMLDLSCDRIGRKLVGLTRERPSVTEERLVSRLMSATAELGDALVELMTWLDQSPDRTPVTQRRLRGRERQGNGLPE